MLYISGYSFSVYAKVSMKSSKLPGDLQWMVYFPIYSPSTVPSVCWTVPAESMVFHSWENSQSPKFQRSKSSEKRSQNHTQSYISIFINYHRLLLVVIPSKTWQNALNILNILLEPVNTSPFVLALKLALCAKQCNDWSRRRVLQIDWQLSQ